MKKLIIVDLSNIIYRSYFAIRPLHAPDGTPVNALSGTISMILKMIEEERPSHILIAKDMDSPSFRKQKHPEYKANRKTPDNELIIQIPLIHKLLDFLGLTQIGIEGYEADDIIASACKTYQEFFDQILIFSSDKDLMQLVNEKVSMLDPKKGILDPEKVKNKMGVPPEQILDYLSILGDNADNIKGIKGIGAKGAASLLLKYNTLDNIYNNLHDLKGSIPKKLLESKKEAYIARSLIELMYDAELPEINELNYMHVDKSDTMNFLKNLGFKGLIYKLEKFFH